MWRDQVRSWRQRLAIRMALRTQEMLGPLGPRAEAVSLKLLLTCIESASMEEDDELQNCWAALLANAAIEEGTNQNGPMFTSILSQLCRTDARFLRFHLPPCGIGPA